MYPLYVVLHIYKSATPKYGSEKVGEARNKCSTRVRENITCSKANMYSRMLKCYIFMLHKCSGALAGLLHKASCCEGCMRVSGLLHMCKDSASDGVMEWLSVLVGVSAVIECISVGRKTGKGNNCD